MTVPLCCCQLYPKNRPWGKFLFQPFSLSKHSLQTIGSVGCPCGRECIRYAAFTRGGNLPSTRNGSIAVLSLQPAPLAEEEYPLSPSKWNMSEANLFMSNWPSQRWWRNNGANCLRSVPFTDTMVPAVREGSQCEPHLPNHQQTLSARRMVLHTGMRCSLPKCDLPQNSHSSC